MVVLQPCVCVASIRKVLRNVVVHQRKLDMNLFIISISNQLNSVLPNITESITENTESCS